MDKLKVGDLVVGDTKFIGWVTKVHASSLELMDLNGFSKRWTPPKVSILESNGVLVVQNLGSLVGGDAGLTGLQGSLLPLMMMGGDVDFDSILPLLLFQGQSGALTGTPAAGAAPAANPLAAMLPMLLLSKGGNGGGLGDIDPMMLMMMSGGLGGAPAAGGVNPMTLLLMGGMGKKNGNDAIPALRDNSPARVRTTNLGAGDVPPLVQRR